MCEKKIGRIPREVEIGGQNSDFDEIWSRLADFGAQNHFSPIF
jgi:hypothetical protein